MSKYELRLGQTLEPQDVTKDRLKVTSVFSRKRSSHSKTVARGSVVRIGERSGRVGFARSKGVLER
jgi:hypothetical protein